MGKSLMLWCLFALLFIAGCKQKPATEITSITIGQGQIPNIAADKNNVLHIVYGIGDSVMYQSSADGGKSLTAPALIGTVPGLFDFAMRGPQIACTQNGVAITACNKQGNIFSFIKSGDGPWQQSGRVNDLDTVAKEGLMALAGDGNLLYAAWLDLRGNSRNKIAGAASHDGGKTWLPNTVIYISPDTTVCECCKPSVAVKGGKVYVMFRNKLHGNRDLYVAQSADGGSHFVQPEKAGIGTWPLDGCPMDGGGLAIANDNAPQTVWRRRDTIFACGPLQRQETALGVGAHCSIAVIGNKNIYAWVEKGEVVCLLPDGVKQYVGKGTNPVLRDLNNGTVACVWENDKQVQAAVITL